MPEGVVTLPPPVSELVLESVTEPSAAGGAALVSMCYELCRQHRLSYQAPGSFMTVALHLQNQAK